MIRTPRRSVTRFFIPMIDVLTVLFCMFLLMPIIRENESAEDSEIGDKKTPDEMRSEIQDLFSEAERARANLASLEKKQLQLRQEVLCIKVINISPKDGSLSYFDTAQPGQAPLDITSPEIARALIDKHRKEAGPLKLVYVFTRPYDPAFPHTLQPDQQLMTRYRHWFEGVECTGLVTNQPAVEKAGPG